MTLSVKPNTHGSIDISLGEVNELYNAEYQHYPDTAKQLSLFCQYNDHGYTYAQCARWWDIQPSKLRTILDAAFSISKKRSSAHSAAIDLMNIPTPDSVCTLKNELNICYKTILSKWKRLMKDEHKYNNEITQSIARYNHFINQCKQRMELGKVYDFIAFSYPLHIDIQLLWRVHLLHPYQYKSDCPGSDCLKYFGFKLSPLYAFINLLDYRNTQNTDDNASDDLMDITDFTAIDFKKCVLKELQNMAEIVSRKKECQKIEKSDFISRWKSDYNTYMSYNRSIINVWSLVNIPTEIKFVWHTHLLFPQHYLSKKRHHQKYRNIATNRYHHDDDYQLKDREASTEFWNNKHKGKKYLMYIVKKFNHKIAPTFIVHGYFRVIQTECDILVPMEIIGLCLQFYDSDAEPEPPKEDTKSDYRFRHRRRRQRRRMPRPPPRHSVFANSTVS
eukprot:1056858_1